jgi:signal transduction histidine kinase
VLAVVAGASSAATITSGTLIQPLGLLVALYTVAAHCARRDATRAGAATAVVLAWPLLRDSGYNIRVTVLKAGFLAVGWVFGAYLGELRARAAAGRREQQLKTARAVAEEQARVGRELHDIIAHTLSVIVVQAAAAGDVFDSSPDRARQALGSIEATGRQALAELRRVLDAIRPAASQSPPPAPPPGLAQLDALLSQVRGTGLAVTLRTEGAAEDLPVGIDTSAYRIVQEALTNTLKYARATTAEVALVFHPQGLIIDIRDDGQPASPPTDGAPHPGRGLIGMHERVALYGGSLTAAPRPQGGFQVHARFPLLSQGSPL